MPFRDGRRAAAGMDVFAGRSARDCLGVGVVEEVFDLVLPGGMPGIELLDIEDALEAPRGRCNPRSCDRRLRVEGYLPLAPGGRGGSVLSWLYARCGCGISLLSGVAGKGRLAEEAVLLGVCGTSAPALPLPLPRLERSNAARVGVTPSSSRMPGMSPVCPSALSGLEATEYTLDSETDSALARRPAEEVEYEL